MVPNGKKRKRTNKVSIGMRLHPAILSAFRREAVRRRMGYQTLIGDVLNGAALTWEERDRRKAS